MIDNVNLEAGVIALLDAALIADISNYIYFIAILLGKLPITDEKMISFLSALFVAG